MGEAIQHAMAAHAWEALVIVFLLAWLEYVFPPVPGDSTMLFGFFLAGSGALSFLAVNRFIPGVRGFFLYAAGIGRMEARGVVIYSSLSNVLWVAVLAWGGTGLGSTWEEVRVVFRRYVWGIAVFLAVYLGLSIARSRRRRRVGLRSSS